MVIDHIQYHFDAGIMESVHHIAESLNTFWTIVARRRRKKAQRVVSPEIFQSFIEQMLIVREPVNG
ncbi:Uncharacterised protein [Salmonella enterica subsp. enterica serovar Bovismorbificans]|nr:Uncharacterised protein [Salmonella enterica subsp. enterica serovar Bovismorbificans]CPR42253.1 Uncharacterised protein [Salmonella enterica subsp. enterica serovar Bovismorbificans]